MLVTSMILALLGGTAECGTSAALATAAAESNARFLVLGEIHGTSEAPTAFGDWVCAVSRNRPVIVGLEYEDSAQSALDNWMGSAGTEIDRQVLLASTAFTRRFEDGRSSRAMLDLLETLRALKVSGRDLRVVAFRSSTPPADGFDQNYGELTMAHSLAAMSQSRPDAQIMVLLGRFHASQQPIGEVRPAFAHLPDKDVLSISLEPQGGGMWTCGGDGPIPECGRKSMSGADSGERGLRLSAEPGPFDGRLYLGPTSPSPPARGKELGQRDQPSRAGAAILLFGFQAWHKARQTSQDFSTAR